MTTDRVAAAAQQVKGSVKEAIGKLTGDAPTEAQGAQEKAAANAVKGDKKPISGSKS